MSREVVVECKERIPDEFLKSKKLMNVDERPFFEPNVSCSALGHPDWNRQSGSVFELKDVGWIRPSFQVCREKPASREWMKRVMDSNRLVIGIVREVSQLKDC